MVFPYIVLLFLLQFCITNAADECSQTNIPSFIIDDYTFLQSPNFPQTLYSNATSSTCNANLVAKNSNYFLWIAMLNGAAPRLEVLGNQNNTLDYYKYHYNSNEDAFYVFDIPQNNVTFKAFSNSSSQPWSAFQAAVISYDPSTANSTCPLAQSDNEIVDFIAFPDLIIPITSSFNGESENITKKCKWNFNISPSQQQLKLVMSYLRFADNSSLTVYADGNLIYNFTSAARANSPLYFNGSVFNVVFTNSKSNMSNYNFFATVSAVKLTPNFTSAGCQMFAANSSSTVFTNIDYVNGYPPYQFCNHTINIPTNHEAIIGLYETNFEACCDSVSLVYFNNSQNTSYTWHQHNLGHQMSLTASGSHITFISDGNVKEAGYKAILNTYGCVCGKQNYFVECNKSITIIPLADNMYYCDNMNCTYQIISNCSNQYFRFDPWGVDGLRDGIDYLSLLKNGKIIKNYTSEDYADYEIIMHDENSTLIFQSGKSDSSVADVKYWSIDVTPMYPKFTKFVLDAETPSHAIWIPDISKANEAYTACATTGSLEIFITVYRDVNIWLQTFYLYDSDILESYIGSLDESTTLSSPSDSLPQSRQSTSGCFTIYNSAKFDYEYLGNITILFKTIDESVRNCENNITVFQVPVPPSNSYDIYVNSTDAGPCRATFLAASTYRARFPFLFVYEMNTSSTENLIFISEANNKKFLEINPSEINLWKDFVLFTPAISVIVPPSSYLYMWFRGHDPTNMGAEVQKGIMASPSYFGYLDSFTNFKFPLLQSHYSNIFVKDLYGSPDAVIQEYENFTLMNVTLTLGESMTFTDYFYLLYEEKNPTKNGFLIEYTAYKTSQQPPTTSPAITTSKTVVPNTTIIATTTPTITKAATSSISITASSVSVSTSTVLTSPATPTTITSTTTTTTTPPGPTTKKYDPNPASISVINSFLIFYIVLIYVFFK